MQRLSHFNSFFTCKLRHADLLLLFSLCCHKDPGATLLRFEEHRPRCANVHGGGVIMRDTRTRGLWGSYPGMIFRYQLTEPTSLIWKVSQYCT